MFNAVKEKELVLSFYKEIESDSTQGKVGIFSIIDFDEKKNSFLKKSENKKNQIKYSRDEILLNQDNYHYLYKFGNSSITLSRHEYIIANNLSKSCSHLPHFMRPLCYTKNVFLNENFKPPFSPFDLEHVEQKNIIISDLVVFEYIKDSHTMYDFIIENVNKDAELSSFVQILLSIICAQQKCKFVHNDLHMNNILMSKCPENLILKYILNIEGKRSEFYINTHGYIPTIIDYGYSYSADCIGTGLDFASLSNDTIGIEPYTFDEYTDFFRIIPLFHHAIMNKYKEYIDIQSSSHNVEDILNDLKIAIESVNIVIENSQDDKPSGHYIFEIIQKMFNEINDNNNFEIKINGELINEKFISFLIYTIKIPYSKYSNVKIDYNSAVESFYEILVDLEYIYYSVEKYQFYYIFRMICENIQMEEQSKPECIEKLFKDIVDEIETKYVIEQINWTMFSKNFLLLIKFFSHELYLNTKKISENRQRQIKTYFRSCELLLKFLLTEINQHRNFNKINDQNFKVIYVIDNISNKNYYETY